jgi:hypothetical protein
MLDDPQPVTIGYEDQLAAIVGIYADDAVDGLDRMRMLRIAQIHQPDGLGWNIASGLVGLNGDGETCAYVSQFTL